MKKIKENVYEVEAKEGVQGIIYASEKLMQNISQDKTLQQVKNVSFLPGIIQKSIALPDAHQGYGFPIGGVAAFDLKKGIISPGGVGYDINCGIRVLITNLKKEDLKKNKKFLEKLYDAVPSGLGRGSDLKWKEKEFEKILNRGIDFLIEKGYATEEDKKNIEEEGFMKGADASKVSKRAKQRGIGQLGTLGAGNHFVEVQSVETIFEKEVAKNFGLEKNQIVIMIHTGSRGLGHQVASDYLIKMEEEYGSENLPDRELIYAPINSRLGKDYFSAMKAACNYAFCNRQLIAYKISETFKESFPKVKIKTLYDVAHNIAKIEEHNIDGKKREVCVHRKGATRSFGKGRKEVPLKYRKFGQPVMIPGSMGTSSYILVGSNESEKLSFGSTAHGAGRVLSRSRAMREIKSRDVKKSLEKKEILIKSGSEKSLIEEAPEVYKDISEVVDVIDALGLSKKVVELKPLLVIKG